MMLKCLACGSRIADTAFVKLVEKQNPLVSPEKVELELEREYPNFQCHSCDFPYNKLVPEREWGKLREQVMENIVQFQKNIAKSYDRLSRKLQSETFKRRADRYRLSARYNRRAITQEDSFQR